MENTMPQKLSIGYLLKQSWHLVSGTKGAIFWCGVFTLLVAVVVNMVINWALKQSSHSMVDAMQKMLSQGNAFVWLLLNLPMVVQNFIMAPFFVGFWMIAIRRTRGETLRYMSGLEYFYKWISVGVTIVIVTLINMFITWVLLTISLYALHSFGQTQQNLMTMMGIISFIVLFFSILATFAMPLVVDKEMSPLRAILTSAKGVAKHYLLLILLLILSLLINLIGMVCLLIGVLWTMPMTFIMFGLLYRYIFEQEMRL